MTLKDEISIIVQRNSGRRKNIQRDTLIVLEYYGMGESPHISLQEVGKKHGISSRERPRQIISEFFTNNIQDRDLKSLKGIISILNEKQGWLSCEFQKKIFPLIESVISLSGLVNLINEVFPHDQILVCDHSLNIVKGENINKDNLVVLNNLNYTRLKPLIQKLLKLPGKIGLCTVDKALSHIKPNSLDKEFIINTLHHHPDIALIDDEELWSIKNNADAIFEENRICFVCVSRAKRVCILMNSTYYTEMDYRYGEERIKRYYPSRYINQLKDMCINK